MIQYVHSNGSTKCIKKNFMAPLESVITLNIFKNTVDECGVNLDKKCYNVIFISLKLMGKNDKSIIQNGKMAKLNRGRSDQHAIRGRVRVSDCELDSLCYCTLVHHDH